MQPYVFAAGNQNAYPRSLITAMQPDKTWYVVFALLFLTMHTNQLSMDANKHV